MRTVDAGLSRQQWLRRAQLLHADHFHFRSMGTTCFDYTNGNGGCGWISLGISLLWQTWVTGWGYILDKSWLDGRDHGPSRSAWCG